MGVYVSRRALSNKKSFVASTRIPLNLKNAMLEIIRQDTHLNESDFIRVAIREKVEKMAPHLVEIKEE